MGRAAGILGVSVARVPRRPVCSFIDKVKKDPKHAYWQGNKLAVAQMKWAFAIAGDES